MKQPSIKSNRFPFKGLSPKVRLRLLGELKETYRDSLIILAHQDGMSVTDIAKEMGLDKSTVSRILSKNKLPGLE